MALFQKGVCLAGGDENFELIADSQLETTPGNRYLKQRHEVCMGRGTCYAVLCYEIPNAIHGLEVCPLS